MGLEPFEVRFFFGERFTKIDLALEVVIKNRSKVVWGLSIMCLKIWLKNFFFQKSYGNTTRLSFFYTQKKISLQLTQDQTRAQKKKRWKLDIRYLIPKCFSPWSFLTHIKNHMGLEGFFWMESLFVGQKNVAWIDLALNSVSENQSKLAQRFFIMFQSIWLRNFFMSKVFWEYHSIEIFFRRQIF